MGQTAYGKDLTPVSVEDICKKLAPPVDQVLARMILEAIDNAGFMVISKPKEPAPVPTGE